MQVHNSQAELSTISEVVGALENLNIVSSGSILIRAVCAAMITIHFSSYFHN